MRKVVPLCLIVVFVSLIAACGGGGGDTVVASDCTARQVVKAGATRDHSVPEPQEGQGGDGSGDGDGDGDGNGSLGQFFGATVVVKNKSFEEIGRAVVDAKGEVNVNIGPCKEPVEVAFLGADGAEYYDEATDQRESFPEGKALRARFGQFGKNFSVTPYTEAAVRLMDSTSSGSLGNGSLSSPVDSKSSADLDTLEKLVRLSSAAATKAESTLDKTVIDLANRRVGEVLTDQVPGFYRPRNADGSFGVLDITAAATALNDDNFKIPGTLRDNVVGHRGAVIAGLVKSGGSFLVNEAQPAVEVAEQLAADLSDGKLDLQSLDGPLLLGGKAPAYTFESLWRAKAVGAGLVVDLAGEQSLKDKANSTPIAFYRSGLASVYYAPDAPTGGFTTGTTANQQVELTSSGVVRVARSVAAGFKTNEWYENTRFGEPQKVTVPGQFVDVKVGTRGQIAALSQDRKSISYTFPFDLYRVTGREFPGFATGDSDKERRRTTAVGLLDSAINVSTATLQIDTAFQDEQRIVSYTTSPVDRTFQSGQKPDVIAVLQEGSLVGATATSPNIAIQLASPTEGLLGVAYDKFVPPASDPQTGNASGVSYPYDGPRRLYGLTRDGKVKTWLEATGTNDIGGRQLDVPGTAVLLATESITNVYALNSDGQVFWVNADQAVAPSLGTRFKLTDLNPAAVQRRYQLNQVVPVDLGGRKACWIGRSEAIICGTGEVFRWEEQFAQVDYRTAGSQFASRVVVPVGIGPGTLVSGTNQPSSSIWRFSGVESQYAIVNGQSVYTEGMSYLEVDGEITDLEELRGLRNLDLPTLRFDDPDRDPGPELRRGITGAQFQKALSTAYGEQERNFSINSTFSTDEIDHRIDLSIRRLGGNRFSLSAVVDGGRDQQLWPNVDIKLKLNTGGSGFNGVRVSNLVGGDQTTYIPDDNLPLFDPTDSGPGQLSNAPSVQGPRIAGSTIELPLDSGLNSWQAFYRDADAVADRAIYGVSAIRSSVSLLFVSGIDPYGFRICFSYEFQITSNRSRFGGLICTAHSNDGSYKGATALLTQQAFDNSGKANGAVQSLDFEHYYASPFL